MKVIYIGATRRTGTSAKTGNPYDICVLTYGVPVQNKNTEKYDYHGYGSEIREVNLDPSALKEFASLQTCEEVDLQLTPNPTNPRVTICTGFSQ